MNEINENTTLFERVGGAPFIENLVGDFYGRILSDPELRHFFESISVAHLKKMQAEFFAAALDGPISRTDYDLARIHKPLNITRGHLTRFVDHLIALLTERQAIDQKDAMAIVFRIAIYSNQILGSSGGVDG